MATMRNLLHNVGKVGARDIWLLPRHVLILIVSGYQHTLSPDHGPMKALWTYGYCRHEPTCSEYSKDALRRNGAVVGSIKSLWRVLSCHPWKKLSEEKIVKIAHK